MFKKLFLVIFCICTFSASLIEGRYKYPLAVTAVFRDEAPYLKEWIEYHALQGAKHFYLYNNLSKDNFKEVLQPYINGGIVELIDWPYESKTVSEWDGIQIRACNDALARAKNKAEWLAIIDVDEFLVPIKDKNMVQFLKRYANYPNIGGVCLIWVFFGTSHVEKIPDDKLMIEMLTLNGGMACGGDVSAVWNSGAYKSIVKPDKVTTCVSPHYCLYKRNCQHMMSADGLSQINHYWTKDEWFFHTTKLPRRKAWGYAEETTIAWAAGMNHATPQSSPILRFVAQLRNKMNLP